MDSEHRSENGSLMISEDVVATIAATAAREVEGVTIAGDSKSGWNLFSHSNARGKNVSIQLDGTDATINLNVHLKFGIGVRDAAEQVQKKVKESVQNMTGITVSKVNVNVDGVVIAPEIAEK